MDGEVIPDLRQELPGRGVWVGNNRGLVQEAVKRNLFARDRMGLMVAGVPAI